MRSPVALCLCVFVLVVALLAPACAPAPAATPLPTANTTAAPLPTASITATHSLSPTPSPSPTATSTSAPQPTATHDAHQQVVDFLKSSAALQALQQYATAEGLNMNDVATRLQDPEADVTLKDYQGNPFEVLVDPQTQTPLLITENGEWKEVSLKDSTVPVSFHLDSNKLPSIRYQLLKNADSALLNWDIQWAPTQPSANKVSDFNAKDKYVHLNDALSLIDTNNMSFIVGSIFWPEQYPQWLKDGGATMTQDELKQKMQARINDLAKAFGNRKGVWVVSNEYAPPEYIAGGGMPDVLLEKFGPEYVDIAFQMARATLPVGNKLIINHGLNDTRKGSYYQISKGLADRLKSKELIDGVGFQMHLNGNTPTSKEELIATMKSYGLPIYITELDINMKDVGGTQEERMAKQAEMYKTVIDACVESGVCVNIGFFDVGDANSWYEQPGARYMASPKADATLFDDNMQPKLAYYSILKSFLEHNALK